jgi:putative transposase
MEKNDFLLFIYKDIKNNKIKKMNYEKLSDYAKRYDVNGSLNIMIKAIPNIFLDGIEGVGVHPFKLNI